MAASRPKLWGSNLREVDTFIIINAIMNLRLFCTATVEISHGSYDHKQKAKPELTSGSAGIDPTS